MVDNQSQLHINADYPDCQFCLTVNDLHDMPVVYQDEHVVVILDPSAIRDCHALVIPRDHYPALLDLEPHAAAKVTYAIALLVTAICTVTGADGLALLQDDPAHQSLEENPHFHVHLVPHFKDDGRDAVTLHESHLSSVSEEQVALVVERLTYHLSIAPDDNPPSRFARKAA